MKISNGKYSYKKLIKSVLPSVFTMVFLSIYSVVDGFFVSNFVGKTSLAAVNLIFPVTMGIGAIGFMLGAGGSALVAKTLGEGNKERADRIFSMVIYFNLILGVIFSIFGGIFIKEISVLLGATDTMLDYCVSYGRIMLAGEFLFMTQNVFQNFFVAANKANLGFLATVVSGVTNIIFDAVFIIDCKWGIAGAGAGTVLSYAVGAIFPLVYFSRKNNKSAIRLVFTKFEFRPIWKSCTNGSSEFLTNVSQSIVSMLFNMQLLKFAGENGVAAYGIMMYVGFVFSAIYFGYALGVSPIISYEFGAKNNGEIRNLLIKSLVINSVLGAAMLLIVETCAYPLSYIFASYDKFLLELTVHGFRLYGISYLISGFNIFGSAFFTALNDGLISAIISIMRTLVFQVAAILIMPLIWELDGVWLSVVAAEILALIIVAVCTIVKRKKYGYGKVNTAL